MSLFCCERAPAGIADRHTPRNTNGQGGIRTHGTLAGTPVFETGRFNRSRTCPRIGWDSNPRNGYPFTRSPGVCLQPLGHLSKLLEAQTRSKYTGRHGFATAGPPMNPDRAPLRIMSVILPPCDPEEAPVSSLPSQP